MFQNMVGWRLECIVNVNQSINIHTVLNSSQTLHLSNSYNFHSSVLAAIKFLSYSPYRKQTEQSSDKYCMLSVKHKWFWGLLYHSSLILHPPKGIKGLNFKEASSFFLILQPQLILKYFCISLCLWLPAHFVLIKIPQGICFE